MLVGCLAYYTHLSDLARGYPCPSSTSLVRAASQGGGESASERGFSQPKNKKLCGVWVIFTRGLGDRVF
ncbi:MAG: hypothetical protein MJE68_07510 [Proteobacteria bacterium]|nr:hypothetical protein [Pseudomonadota bacterium]